MDFVAGRTNADQVSDTYTVSQGPRMEGLRALPETKVDHACEVSTVGFSSTCRPRFGLYLGNDLPQGWGDVVERRRGHCIHLVAPIIHFFGGSGRVPAYDEGA